MLANNCTGSYNKTIFECETEYSYSSSNCMYDESLSNDLFDQHFGFKKQISGNIWKLFMLIVIMVGIIIMLLFHFHLERIWDMLSLSTSTDIICIHLFISLVILCEIGFMVKPIIASN